MWEFEEDTVSGGGAGVGGGGLEEGTGWEVESLEGEAGGGCRADGVGAAEKEAMSASPTEGKSEEVEATEEGAGPGGLEGVGFWV